MLIDTRKARRRLAREYGLDERAAEGIVEIISSAEDQVATKDDLDKEMQAMEERLKKTVYRAVFIGVGVVLTALAICTTIIVSYG